MYSTDIIHGTTNTSVSLADLLSIGNHSLIHASVAQALFYKGNSNMLPLLLKKGYLSFSDNAELQKMEPQSESRKAETKGSSKRIKVWATLGTEIF